MSCKRQEVYVDNEDLTILSSDNIYISKFYWREFVLNPESVESTYVRQGPSEGRTEEEFPQPGITH